MQLSTLRFGEIDIKDDSIITFPGGLPGLDELQRYAIVRYAPTEPVQWLLCVDDPDLALPVINPFIVKPDYDIEVDDSELDFIQTHDEEDLMVLSVMVVPDDLTKMTVNLMAPILINTRKMLAAQVMMDHKEYEINYPAFEALVHFYETDDEVTDDAGTVEKA